MRLKKLNPIASLVFIFTTSAPVWAQSVVLQGRTLDADGPPLAGVAVSVHLAACQSQILRSTVSRADGTYELSGLAASSALVVCYSRIGYMPDPLPKSIKTVSSGVQTIADVPLVQNGGTVAYWQTFAAKTKARIDSETSNPSQQALRYQAVWRTLTSIGLSPEAQTEAARQLLHVVPSGAAAVEIKPFADVNDDDLHAVEANISDAAAGKAQLTRAYTIPSTLAVDIAATQVKNHASGTASQQFSSAFENVWGKEAADQLQMKLNEAALNPQVANQVLLMKNP